MKCENTLLLVDGPKLNYHFFYAYDLHVVVKHSLRRYFYDAVSFLFWLLHWSVGLDMDPSSFALQSRRC